MHGKRCFTYCGDLCDCELADEYGFFNEPRNLERELREMLDKEAIIAKRVAPAQEMINENKSFPKTSNVPAHVAPAEGKSESTLSLDRVPVLPRQKGDGSL